MILYKDKYTLGQSLNKSILNVCDEIRLDVELSLDKETVFAKVYGFVHDLNSVPINGALVQIYDSNLNPLIHEITDANGYFIFDNTIPIPGLTSFQNISSKSVQSMSINSPIIYNISAIALGKALKFSTSFTLQNGDIKIRNFILESDSSSILSLIAGNIYDNISFAPIIGGVLSLYKINDDNTESLVQLSFSSDTGSFIFPDLSVGTYKLKIKSLGYLDKILDISIMNTGEILSFPTPMIKDPLLYLGTISGVITNNLNEPIERADVILYTVNDINALIPIAFAKTNISGVYLFTNIPQGYYKIKSNELIINSFTIE